MPLPLVGGMPVDRIGRQHVLSILTPIRTKSPVAVRKMRGRIRTTLARCQAHGYVEQNVAGEVINAALPAMPPVSSHCQALPYQAVGSALETLETSGMSLCVHACREWRRLLDDKPMAGQAYGMLSSFWASRSKPTLQGYPIPLSSSSAEEVSDHIATTCSSWTIGRGTSPVAVGDRAGRPRVPARFAASPPRYRR